MFVAIMKSTDNRVDKLAQFDAEADADAHVAEFIGRYPDAFTAPLPVGALSDWFIDPAAKTITIVPPPAPDFGPKDQALIESRFNVSGIDRAELRLLFEVIKAMKTGNLTFFDTVVDAATFKTLARSLIR